MAYIVLSEELLLVDASEVTFFMLGAPRRTRKQEAEVWKLFSSCITVIFSFLLTIRKKYVLIIKEARYNISIQEGMLSRC